MHVEVREETVSMLPEYGTVPISFQVTSRLRLEPVQEGLGGLSLVQEPVSPYVKDYDAIAGEGPACWAHHWDVSH